MSSVKPCDVASFGSEPLLTLPNGHFVDLASGYIPLLARFTFEDKAAKGLRKRKPEQKPEPPIHFSALELVRDNQILLLTGPSGSGKTSFAKHLCFRLATGGFGEGRPLVRNELGDVRQESWSAGKIQPQYHIVSNTESLKTLVNVTLPSVLQTGTTKETSDQDGTLIILDGVEKAGEEAPELLATLSGRVKKSGNTRLLVHSETSTCRHWVLPSDIVRHELLPLLAVQRRAAVSDLLRVDKTLAHVGTGAAAGSPALFALALQAKHDGGRAEDLLDAWLSAASSPETSPEDLAERAYDEFSDGLRSGIPTKSPCSKPSSNPSLSCDMVKYLLVARHLSGLHPDATVQLFRQNSQASQLVIRSLLSRLSLSGKAEPLIDQLLNEPSPGAQRAALIVAEFAQTSERIKHKVKNLVLEIVTQGTLPASDREKAGCILSRLGDPRDFEALAFVPAGSFTMGSMSHPNSQPPHTISLSAFRIGVYPVVNKDYLAFTQDTGREWLSPDGADPVRQNAPATDLTWHDARAYCAWLTTRWRSSGSIGPEEEVRLPTEPEWERAARGNQIEAGRDGLVYPWGTTWREDAANSEEAGFNSTCAVGLFPKGRSPYGCYDMAGHVWEWCTTLWGEDMATPSFWYPWREDDREALGAPEQIRRVLRGGCFSSPKIKANCTYRGSLEPSGFWRGNGFRVVVGKAQS